MGHWSEAKIKDFAEVKGGKRLPKGKQLIKESNSHPYIKVRNLGKEKYIQLNSDYEYVDDETQKSIARYIVNKGDILISVVGTIGLVGIVGDTLDKANQTENCDKIINIKDVLPEYLYYYLISSFGQDEIRKGTVGAVQPKLPLKNVKDISILYPLIEEQERIVNILSSIDKKIEMNNAINNNLIEQLNQFYTEFSTRKQWPEMTIGDIAEKVAMGPFGSNIKVSTFVEKGIPIISGNHLRNYFLEEPSYNYITEEHASKLKNSIVYPNDIVFTHAGNIGQVAMIPEGSHFPYYVISQRQFYLRCNTELITPVYVLLFFHSKIGQHELLSYANQTGVPSIARPATNLKKIRIPIPSLDEQKEWLSVISPIIKMYQNNYLEIERLSILRDTLLPKLMSGELDVSNINI